MKVVLVHNSYQQGGGEDTVYEQECELLRRHDVHVVQYRRDNDLAASHSAVARVHLAKNAIWSSRTYMEFRSFLNRERTGIGHVYNTLFRISPSVYWACKEAGVPVVQTLHNYRLLCPGGQFTRSSHLCEECIDAGVWHGVRYGCYRNSRVATGVVALMVSFHRWRKTWTNCIDGYIALSEFSRSKFVEGGFPTSKIFVKPNFVYPYPGIGGGHINAVFLARLVPGTGIRKLFSDR